jgi:hypothetical protein
MVLRKLTGVFSIALVIGAATFAVAGVPDLQLSTASTAAGVGVTPVMYNLPNGAGCAFTAANGGAVNATVSMTVLDGGGIPVFNFSAADMYLVPIGAGNFFACANGTIATFNTNASGITQWLTPLRAGGWMNNLTQIYISGSPLTSNAGLLLWHNSADISGNGIADLGDIGIFAGDYYGGVYAFRSDLTFDNAVNLGDIGALASGIGTSCPQ